ncbi:cation transport protein-domain-containing protein [Apodospora peruviana]|uniref:Potassium transport protein n=1 Tax=Apodospora peruviana TaxID=516989 RepID=A0AAE0M7M5_9PEZI|nr:cation transport protein-domain-containing protein [Apodospora peruviana]
MEQLSHFWRLVVAEVRSWRPAFLHRNHRHFDFITVHYLWITGLMFLGSVLVYGAGGGGLAYIDALFFAAGGATQAGLNTVDVSNLSTFQQVVLYFEPMLTNPITMNAGVLFLRLYWFERKFQDLVREARQRRGTISKSKAKARSDSIDPERGVNGRRITVMHNSTRSRIANDGMLLGTTENKTQSNLTHEDIAPDSDTAAAEEQRKPEIKFSDTVIRSDGLGIDNMKFPPLRTDEEHIAILERQRNGGDEVLRIPGPRDAERGMRPERVEHEDDGNQEPLSPGINLDGTHRAPQLPRHQPTIAFEEPDRRKLEEDDEDEPRLKKDAKAFANVFSFLKIRIPRIWGNKKNKVHHGENELHMTVSRQSRKSSFHNLKTAFTQDKYPEGTPYLSWEPTIGRNSDFPDLTEEQREELGGIEYRSLKKLALVVTGYFWFFSTLGVVCLVPWILNMNTYGEVVDAVHQNRTWWGFFTANSAFLDVGFTLTPDSMNSFNTATFPLLLMSFLIIIGNTGFPVMLRFIIWCLSLITPQGTGSYEELRFLLDHPRRCFTLLFPSNATWWLFWLLVFLNGLDVMFFIVLDLGSGPVTELSPGIKVLNGLFEAASTRTAGFSCINLALLHPGVQVSYMIMMYISVFPIAISVRRTNVYEEKSLGIYNSKGGEVDEQANNASGLSYVSTHLRRQLSFDLWCIFIAFFILAISEGGRIMAGDFSMFAILFEIVSAYGTVGMSLGYPTVNASLCSQFSVVGKLVLIGLMIRGRHRGLPHGLDRAILLPGDTLNAVDQADNDPRLARTMSRASVRSGDRGILSSLLHPGPPIPEVFRRSTIHSSALHGLHDGDTSRLTRRRTESSYRTAPIERERSPHEV